MKRVLGKLKNLFTGIRVDDKPPPTKFVVSSSSSPGNSSSTFLCDICRGVIDPMRGRWHCTDCADWDACATCYEGMISQVAGVALHDHWLILEDRHPGEYFLSFQSSHTVAEVLTLALDAWANRPCLGEVIDGNPTTNGGADLSWGRVTERFNLVPVNTALSPHSGSPDSTSSTDAAGSHEVKSKNGTLLALDDDFQATNSGALQRSLAASMSVPFNRGDDNANDNSLLALDDESALPSASGPAAPQPRWQVRWQTFGQIRDRARAFGTGLREALYSLPNFDPNTSLYLDEPSGQRLPFVAVCGANSAQWFVADIGNILCRMVTIPIHFTLSVDDIVDICEQTELDVAVVDESLLSVFREVQKRCPSLRLLIVIPSRTVTLHARSGSHILLSDEGTEFVFDDIESRGFDIIKQKGFQELPLLSPKSLFGLVFTSGSTGRPKGAVFLEHSFTASLLQGAVVSNKLNVSVTFNPLAHSSPRRHVIQDWIKGTRVGICRGTAGSDYTGITDSSELVSGKEWLIHDISLIRPTSLSSTPRLFQHVQELFAAELSARVARQPTVDKEVVHRQLTNEFSLFFGDRLRTLVAGGAPVGVELKQFLDHTFKCMVHDGYGATEVGGIMADGMYFNNVNVKLRDCPELGYYVSDGKGEVCVRTKTMVEGYWKNPEQTRENFTEDGYFLTGDIAEITPDRRYRVIDRKKNVFKLAQGEFVAPERLEGAYANESDLISQICVVGDFTKSSVVAVVVPNDHFAHSALQEPPTVPLATLCQDERLVKLILNDLSSIAQKRGFQAYEVPVKVFLSPDAFTADNKMLTATFKLNRHGVKKAFAEEIEDLYADLDSQGGTFEALLSHALGGPGTNENATFAELGGDSLAAVRLAEALRSAYELKSTDLTAGDILRCKTMRELREKLRSVKGSQVRVSTVELTSQNASQVVRPRDEVDWVKESQTNWDRVFAFHGVSASAANSVKRLSSTKTVLVTGATGFLGAHIISDILSTTTMNVVCLVRAERKFGSHRASDDDADDPIAQRSREKEEQVAASCRLRSTLKSYLLWNDKFEQRISTVVGDLGAPRRLGMADDAWETLCETIDEVFHSAALVNHVMEYADLKPANVEANRGVIALCSSKKSKVLHYVSTMSVLSSRLLRKEESQSRLDPQKDLFLEGRGGYGQSKIVGEMVVCDAASVLPIEVRIYRPGTMWASTKNFAANDLDMVVRTLRGCVALGCAPEVDGTSVMSPGINLAPVDYAARSIVALSQLPKRDKGPSLPPLYHIVNPHGVTTWATLFDAVSQEAQLRRATLPEWRLLVSHVEDRQNPVFAVRYVWATKPGAAPSSLPSGQAHACPETTKALQKIGGGLGKCAAVDLLNVKHARSAFVKLEERPIPVRYARKVNLTLGDIEFDMLEESGEVMTALILVLVLYLFSERFFRKWFKNQRKTKSDNSGNSVGIATTTAAEERAPLRRSDSAPQESPWGAGLVHRRSGGLGSGGTGGGVVLVAEDGSLVSSKQLTQSAPAEAPLFSHETRGSTEVVPPSPSSSPLPHRSVLFRPHTMTASMTASMMASNDGSSAHPSLSSGVSSSGSLVIEVLSDATFEKCKSACNDILTEIKQENLRLDPEDGGIVLAGKEFGECQDRFRSNKTKYENQVKQAFSCLQSSLYHYDSLHSEGGDAQLNEWAKFWAECLGHRHGSANQAAAKNLDACRSAIKSYFCYMHDVFARIPDKILEERFHTAAAKAFPKAFLNKLSKDSELRDWFHFAMAMDQANCVLNLKFGDKKGKPWYSREHAKFIDEYKLVKETVPLNKRMLLIRDALGLTENAVFQPLFEPRLPFWMRGSDDNAGASVVGSKKAVSVGIPWPDARPRAGASKLEDCGSLDEVSDFLKEGNRVLLLRDDYVTIGEGKLLGKGYFGTVYRGKVEGGDSVAIKVLEGNALDQVKEAIQEALHLQHFRISKVVNMLGLWRYRETFGIVTEMCALGSLKDVVEDPDRPRDCPDYHYVSGRKCTCRQSNVAKCQAVVLDDSFRKKAAEHIILGMKFLSENGFFHRDLAARNVLVHRPNPLSGEFVFKIGDFGLAKRVEESDFYSAQKNIKARCWTAPEAQADPTKMGHVHNSRAPEGSRWGDVKFWQELCGEKIKVRELPFYTLTSDVWSFGCVLYELFGPLPLWEDWQIEFPESDLHMDTPPLPKPNNCPDAVYGFMKRCWNRNPTLRPSWGELLSELDAWPNTSTASSNLAAEQRTNTSTQAPSNFAGATVHRAILSNDNAAYFGDANSTATAIDSSQRARPSNGSQPDADWRNISAGLTDQEHKLP